MSPRAGRAAGARAPFASTPWPAASVAAVACLAAIAAQRFLDLSLHDEGFLWYGAQRVLRGELPIRDFQAYDPGRYFWVAGWMAMLGHDGILALRWANAVLAAITVGLATWIVGSGSTRPGAIAPMATGATFTLWMAPYIKVSDSFAAILLLFGLTLLIRRPSPGRYFRNGICLGVASVIGINHALYGSVAAILALLYLRGIPNPAIAIAATIVGGVVGYSPVLMLHALVPGFASAFIDGVRQLLESGTTNLSLPFPELLAVTRARDEGVLRSITQSLSALLFIGAPPLWLWAAWRSRRADIKTPAIPAGLILGVPYAHYAYSRADVVHIAVSVLPLLAAALAWIVRWERVRRRWTALTMTFGVALVMTAREHPVYGVLKGHASEAMEIDGARLLVRSNNADEIHAARAVAAGAGSAPFFSGPYMPGAYALARRRSPTWEIYMLFPATRSRQEAEIARLRTSGVRYAFISGQRVDGRPDLGLERTHPLLFAFIRSCLDRATGISKTPWLTIRWTDKAACPNLDEAGRPDQTEWKSRTVADHTSGADHDL
ncbi:hypothetical protein [uncultured Sphingomonas sp.]|uniref:hypothetical protein n=1 Tax=uncultured Sphingomonas sp. TaxID=158754 RepID=UPI0035C9DF23